MGVSRAGFHHCIQASKQLWLSGCIKMIRIIGICNSVLSECVQTDTHSTLDKAKTCQTMWGSPRTLSNSKDWWFSDIKNAYWLYVYSRKASKKPPSRQHQLRLLSILMTRVHDVVQSLIPQFHALPRGHMSQLQRRGHFSSKCFRSSVRY